ncbi:MAG: 5-carboxymethyl-2-hydroxymuconate Delta-isomerase [Cohaesibacteraceae bacterium]|nr:5-carboxymethyl-2-hydroxymuconate Delta-isomerase [Cohaesibacteraceae bacterium]
MPHFSIEYSANLEARIDMSKLCDVLRIAGIETGVFPLAGIRVRAIRCDHYAIADGDAAHGFIDLSVRLRAGRDLETRMSATAHIFAAAKAFLDPVLNKYPLALSMEMRDIDPDLSPKINTIRDRLKEK